MAGSTRLVRAICATSLVSATSGSTGVHAWRRDLLAHPSEAYLAAHSTVAACGVGRFRASDRSNSRSEPPPPPPPQEAKRDEMFSDLEQSRAQAPLVASSMREVVGTRERGNRREGVSGGARGGRRGDRMLTQLGWQEHERLQQC